MTSFDYRLNPLYPIKECSSYGALYTTDYCFSIGILEDKIICDLDKTPDLSQRSLQNCPKCGHPVNGHYCQGCALIRKKFKKDLFTSGIFYHQCTCKLCGNGAHYGYNCPPKVPIIPNPKPFNNQTIKELPPTVQNVDPKSDLVHDQFIQKKEEENQIKEEQATNARYLKIPICYDDDDDGYTFAITPNEPDNSLKLLSNNFLSLPENESFHFDIPLSSRPPAKPPDGIPRFRRIMQGFVQQSSLPQLHLGIIYPNLID
nr:hypothetical protein [Tanacetum cinerariifolium]